MDVHRDQLYARVPKSQRQHYVPRWILKGFTDHHGDLHAWRVREGRAFTTGPEAIFAARNINTAFSDDRTELLAYSEAAYAWLDAHGSRAALAIRDAVREAAWHPKNARVVAQDERIFTWFTALPLRQTVRTPDTRRQAHKVADQFQLTNEQKDVLKVAIGTASLRKSENYLDTGRPTALRARPDDPLIVGDDIVIKGAALPDGKPSFLGVLIDQYTIVGRGFVHDRRRLAGGEVDVFNLNAKDVAQINGQVAANADTIAGSQEGLVSRLGAAEGARRNVRRNGNEHDKR